jgi:hypothetical protein
VNPRNEALWSNRSACHLAIYTATSTNKDKDPSDQSAGSKTGDASDPPIKPKDEAEVHHRSLESALSDGQTVLAWHGVVKKV